MHKTLTLISLVACVFHRSPALGASSKSIRDDLRTITDGVTKLKVPSPSGGLVVFGTEAMPLVASSALTSPLAAIARHATGRVAFFASEHWFPGPRSVRHGDTTMLLSRVLQWLSGRNKRALLIGSQNAAPFFAENGYAVTSFSHSLSELAGPLEDYGVVQVSENLAASSLLQQTLVRYVRAGGGLLLTADGSPISSYSTAMRPLSQLAVINNLAATFGFVLTDTDSVVEMGEVVNEGTERLQTAHLAPLMERVFRAAESNAPLNALDVKSLIDQLSFASASYPEIGGADFPSKGLATQVLALYEKIKTDLLPSPSHPIAQKDLRRRALIALVNFVKTNAPAEAVRVNADAALFPGVVPATAEHITKEQVCDLTIPRWHSTGLYAAPGEVVTVSLTAMDARKQLLIRIGSQGDPLWNNDVWKRWPQVFVHRKLEKPVTKIASAHGGLIYVVVPEGLRGVARVKIANAVQAPTFTLGKTTAEMWRKEELAHTAPWAELISDRYVLTLPTKVVLDLKDPTGVVTWWRRAVDAQTELSQRSGFPYAERYVQDVQISAGYMHAGYPIMGMHHRPQDSVDIDRLNAGTEWGMLHELGHMRQQDAWTFEGTGEVTVNLFSLYANEKMTGVPAWNDPWLKNAKAEALTYLKHPKFEQWKANPSVALVMYAEIVRAFGWKPVQDVLREYALLTKSELPQTDDEKRDQWMLRLGRRLKIDLGSFFDRWAVPVSPQAKASLRGLASWEPPPF